MGRCVSEINAYLLTHPLEPRQGCAPHSAARLGRGKAKCPAIVALSHAEKASREKPLPLGQRI